jgi:glutathione synthase
MTKKLHKNQQKWLWITDPWDTLDHSKDSTLRLIEESIHQGIQTYWCQARSIRLQNKKVVLDARKVVAVDPEREANSFQFDSLKFHSPSEFSKLFYRTDPPVDLAYLHPLQILWLELRNSSHSELINPFKALTLINEKLETSVLPMLAPPSLVSSEREQLLKFIKKEKKTVLKPLYEAQSRGVELLSAHQHNTDSYLKKTSKDFTQPVLIQKYLEGIKEGETRLWFLDGQLLAHFKKFPLINDFRVNIDAGSRLDTKLLTRTEKRAIPQISKHLKKNHIRLAAIDLIDGYIIDFNITSPGLIVEMESLLNENLAKKMVKRLRLDSH